MNTPPTAPLDDGQRDTLFHSWVEQLTAKEEQRIQRLPVTKLMSWRRQFAKAIAQGYTWNQLATEVAPKPEIGIKISGSHLRKCILAAFKLANETPPRSLTQYRRRRAKTDAAVAVQPAAR